jgi:hypothetical protein
MGKIGITFMNIWIFIGSLLIIHFIFSRLFSWVSAEQVGIQLFLLIIIPLLSLISTVLITSRFKTK